MMGLSLSRMMAVLAKEFTQLVRDRLTYAMIIGIPIFQLLLFGYAINTDPKHLPTAVLVQDQGQFARSILGSLQRSEYFRIEHVARSPAEMDELIERGAVQFAITIPGDFTRRVVRQDKPQILVEADASDPAATGSAVAALAALPNEGLKHDLKGSLATAGNADQPFEVVIQRRYNPENITSYNIVPGLVATILTMTLVMMTALAMTRETERGTMETLLSTPLRPIEVMVGKLTPFVLVDDTLITSFPKSAAGLTWEQRQVLERVVNDLAESDRSISAWIDPILFQATPATFPPAWIQRRAADFVTIRLANRITA